MYVHKSLTKYYPLKACTKQTRPLKKITCVSNYYDYNENIIQQYMYESYIFRVVVHCILLLSV